MLTMCKESYLNFTNHLESVEKLNMTWKDQKLDGLSLNRVPLQAHDFATTWLQLLSSIGLCDTWERLISRRATVPERHLCHQ